MQPALKAWQIDRQLRLNAIPVDRRVHVSHWDEMTDFPRGDDLIALFWQARVPGSGAPEIPYVEMVQSLANRGYDVSQAEALLPEGIALAKQKDPAALRALTAELLGRLFSAPAIPEHIYWTYEHPEKWEDVTQAMQISEDHGWLYENRRPARAHLPRLAGAARRRRLRHLHRRLPHQPDRKGLRRDRRLSHRPGDDERRCGLRAGAAGCTGETRG